MMAIKNFPRFFITNPKNENSSGPVLFHLNYPRCVFYLKPGIKNTQVFSYLIDKNAEPEKIKSMKEDAAEWMKKELGDLVPYVEITEEEVKGAEAFVRFVSAVGKNFKR